jgi:hypothetical protein
VRHRFVDATLPNKHSKERERERERARASNTFGEVDEAGSVGIGFVAIVVEACALLREPSLLECATESSLSLLLKESLEFAILLYIVIPSPS